jgi:branched-chain amino acid transport system ATP-binding protein
VSERAVHGTSNGRGQNADGLAIQGLSAGYYGQPVVFDVTLDAPAGQVTALFGHNGAGKTTILRSVVGIVPRMAGRILLGGSEVAGTPRAMFRNGVAYLPQEYATFPGLTVAENLRLGALKCTRAEENARMQRVLKSFPQLDGRRKARTLSGGQQRMLSIGIAMMADAHVLLLDEPSLGLAPAVTQQLLGHISALAHDEGRAVLLVEQAIGQALSIVDHVYVVRSGEVIAAMDRSTALARADWSDIF